MRFSTALTTRYSQDETSSRDKMISKGYDLLIVVFIEVYGDAATADEMIMRLKQGDEEVYNKVKPFVWSRELQYHLDGFFNLDSWN